MSLERLPYTEYASRSRSLAPRIASKQESPVLLDKTKLLAHDLFRRKRGPPICIAVDAGDRLEDGQPGLGESAPDPPERAGVQIPINQSPFSLSSTATSAVDLFF